MWSITSVLLLKAKVVLFTYLNAISITLPITKLWHNSFWGQNCIKLGTDFTRARKKIYMSIACTLIRFFPSLVSPYCLGKLMPDIICVVTTPRIRDCSYNVSSIEHQQDQQEEQHHRLKETEDRRRFKGWSGRDVFLADEPYT